MTKIIREVSLVAECPFRMIFLDVHASVFTNLHHEVVCLGAHDLDAAHDFCLAMFFIKNSILPIRINFIFTFSN